MEVTTVLGIRYDVFLCLVQMVITFPVLFLAIAVLMREDKRPQVDVTCNGDENGNKHKFESWEITKAVTNDNKTTYITQMRGCSKCGYRQFKKVKV